MFWQDSSWTVTDRRPEPAVRVLAHRGDEDRDMNRDTLKGQWMQLKGQVRR